MIPENITGKHIQMAIDYIDKNGVPPTRRSTVYDLSYNGRRYPPKYVICIAYKYAGGNELVGDEFSGGRETNNFLADRGYTTVKK
jgi:hypothetical protein